jgi:3-oxoacyl-[acyl-carrier protein] reductase
VSDRRQVWLITGASRGIGLEIARQALQAGHRVALVARSEDLAAVARSLEGEHMACRGDVCDPASTAEVVEKVMTRWGRIDRVVNNAGMHRGGRIGRLRADDWQAVLDTNLSGAMNTIRAAEPHLQSGAAIVNIGAVVGFRGFPGDSAYAASKLGLAGLTRALAIEFAARGVTVNLVIPGLVLTEMTGALSEKALSRMTRTIPLGRFGEAAEIAEAVLWVANSRYMTGAFVPVDGGLMSSFGVPG